MPKDEHVAVLGRGAAVWNAWRAEHNQVPDLSRAALRGLDLTGFDLSRADLRAADLRGTNLCDADLSGARLEGANFFKVPPGLGTGPGNRGNPPYERVRHYFFDMGNDSLLAFFEIPKGREPAGNRNAIGPMQHCAFVVTAE